MELVFCLTTIARASLVWVGNSMCHASMSSRFSLSACYHLWLLRIITFVPRCVVVGTEISSNNRCENHQWMGRYDNKTAVATAPIVFTCANELVVRSAKVCSWHCRVWMAGRNIAGRWKLFCLLFHKFANVRHGSCFPRLSPFDMSFISGPSFSRCSSCWWIWYVFMLISIELSW